MVIIQAIVNALASAFDMLWEVLWPLALGFLLSAIVQTLVSRNAVARTLGSDSPRSLGIATLLGAASSSCSYAAVAIARSLFLKGASFPAAMVFEFASTNLVFELGLILLILLGWPFLGAEFAGGVLMILILALLFRWTLRPQLVDEARDHAGRGLRGRMEGHAAMDMAITEGPFLRRLFSGRAFTAISHNFWSDVTSVWTDIGLGLLIAGALAAWVPTSFWQGFFLTNHPVLSQVWGPLIGPVISLLSFVCSVGNVPLAAVLWNGGISFGGVIAFIFADLIILPILNIYRKYYGRRISTTSTDPERAGQHAIHAGVRRQGGAERLQPVTEGGLQVPGHGDYEGARLAVDKLIHQGKLLFRPQCGLQDDDIVFFPGAAACRGGRSEE